MKELMRALGRAFLNLIYPVTCPICGARLNENKGLCASCAVKIDKNSFGIAACRYEGVLKEAMRLFKYKGVRSLLGAFSTILLDFIDKNIDMAKIDTIIPIPLHPSKFRIRGFNQAHLLGLAVSRRYDIPISTGNLIKRRPTRPQSSLNRAQRLENLKGVFFVRKAWGLKQKNILLIDDVYTTGTTIDRASKVLRKAGAADVKAVTLARGA